MAKSTQLVTLINLYIIYIYIIGPPTFPSERYKFGGKPNKPCAGCKSKKYIKANK